MNSLLPDNTIAVYGKANALKIAAALIEQEYQVFIQHEDFDVYIVAFTNNDLSLGGDQFALLSEEEVSLVEDSRSDAEDKAALDKVNALLDEGWLNPKDLHLPEAID